MAKRKRTNPVFAGRYRVVLRDKRGRFTTLSRAKTFQLVTPRGAKVFKRVQPFPKEAKRSYQRSDFLHKSVNSLERKRKQQATKRRLAREKKQEAVLKKKLKRAKKPKTKRETKKKITRVRSKIRADRDTLLDGLAPVKEVKKELLSFDKLKRVIHTVTKIYDLPRTPFTARTIEKVLLEFRPYLIQVLQELWKELKPKQRKFILRLIYEDKVKGEPQLLGIGTTREEISKFNSVEKAIDELLRYVEEKFTEGPKAYFAAGVTSSQVTLTGFTIEYNEKEGRRLTKSQLELKKEQEFQDQLDYWGEVRQDTKEELAAERERRKKKRRKKRKKKWGKKK